MMTQTLQPDCPEKTKTKVTEATGVTGTAFVEMKFPSRPGEVRRDIHVVGPTSFRINFWKNKTEGVFGDYHIVRSLYVTLHKEDNGTWSYVMHDD